MEETSLQRKIKNQLEFIKQEIHRFRRGFEGKQVKSNNFTPYLQALNKVFDLNNSYGEDYYQFINKKSLEFMLENNRVLMKDVCAKLKAVSVFLQQSQPILVEKNKFNNGICKICFQHIESQTIQEAKNGVEDMGINKLRNMLKRMQEQGNMALFTADEDKHFFQQLNKVLIQKEEVLSITDNHLEKYLNDLMKNMQEIKYLENLKDTTFTLPPQIDWEFKIKTEINSTLLDSFKGKVPTWIQKTFDYFIKLHTKSMRQLKQSKDSQTDPFTQDEVFELRKHIEQFKGQQKTNKSINHDYLKLMEDKNIQLQNLQIQLNKLKRKPYVKQSGTTSNRESIVTKPKESKSPRNSQMQNQVEKQVNNQQQYNGPKKKLSKFKSILSNSSNGSEFGKRIQNKMHEINEQRHKSTNGEELRNDHSVTEEASTIPSEILEDKPKRRNQKKLTDIDYFRKTKSNQRNDGFFPNINKVHRDTFQQQILNKIKKTSILSNYSQSISKPSDRQNPVQRLDLLALENRVQVSKSIIQVEQATQKDLNESEINLILNLTQSQKNIRLKKYKQKMTDVQSQLQNKVHNIQMLKKTFGMKKKHPSASFSGKLGLPIYEELAKIGGQRFPSTVKTKSAKILANINSETQTDNMQNQQKRTMGNSQNFKIIQNGSLKTDFINQQKGYKNMEIQTEESNKFDILKRLQKNQSISQISDQHLEKVLTKLLFNFQNNKQSKSNFRQKNKQSKKSPNHQSTNKQNNGKSPKNSTYRTKQTKASLQQNQYKIMNQSRVQKSSQQKIAQKQNDKLNDIQDNLPKLLYCKQIPLKQKILQNLTTQNQNLRLQTISLTQKSENTTIKFKDQLVLPSLSISRTELKHYQDSLFTKKDFGLFICEENSFKYESNMKKKYHKTPSTQLTQQQIKNFTSIYNLTSLIKNHSLHKYNQILSFIKYPYQTVVNNFSILNIVKDMSLDTWLWHISMIKYYHKKCLQGKDQNKCICGHVQKFIEKVQDLLVQATFEEGGQTEIKRIKTEVNESPKKEMLQSYVVLNPVKTFFHRE